VCRSEETQRLGAIEESKLSHQASALEQKLLDHSATVGVVGLGYVGLPLLLTIAEAGFPVLGFDTDTEKPKLLSQGESYISHISSERVALARDPGRFSATDDLTRLGEPDVILICVPTPLDANREPDLSYVHATTQQIAKYLRPGQLVILESTTYPGTTRELSSMLETAELACGEHFFLAFSPEREDPGNPQFSTSRIPKVVGGLDPLSGRLASTLYREFVREVVEVASAEVAEACKLTENVFRAVNIALVNELKTVYDRMGIDVWEVLDAAATKPFGFMRFDPGPGWGGHCIPLDPFYLAWKGKQHGAVPRFIELAGEINVEMPGYVVEKLRSALAEREVVLFGSEVLVIGLAYKRDIADPRESPAFEILSRLLAEGAAVSYHDPHIPSAPPMRSWPHLPELRSTPLETEAVQRFDAIVVVTDHSDIDYDELLRHARLIIDTRGVYRKSHPNVVKA